MCTEVLYTHLYSHSFEEQSIKHTTTSNKKKHVQQKARSTRLAKSRLKANKKLRISKLHSKLKEYSEKIMKKERAKADGCVYQPGIGMDGGYCQPVGHDAPEDGDTTPGALSVCNSCCITGHKRNAHWRSGLWGVGDLAFVFIREELF